MVQDNKKNFSPNKPTDTSKNLDNRKTQPHTPDRDTARPMKDKTHPRDKDIPSKRDTNSRK